LCIISKCLKMSRCRLCGNDISQSSHLVLENVPAGAQLFLKSIDAAHEDAINLLITQCEFCGLVQSSSPPVPYCRNVITAAGLSAAMRQHRESQVRKFTDTYGLVGKSAVEIGCGNGFFLEILDKSGLIAFGTEWGGAKGLNYPVADVYPEPGIKIPGGPFNAFFCLNFLEHAPDPVGFLTGIRQNLTEEAAGLIEVPNYMQQRRLGRVFDYIADHVSYFDINTITTMLSISGFVIDQVMETRNGENIEVWLRNRKQSGLSSDAKTIESTYNHLAEWLANQKIAKQNVAVWGASHQALTILARCSSDEISCIFDSAHFKQNLYSPVSHLPVKKPTKEALAGIDCILIIASGYEQEIKSTLIEKLEFAGNIYYFKGNEIHAL